MRLFLAALPLLALSLLPAIAEGPYPVDPASQRQPGVPQGKIHAFEFSSSRIYPGTTRKYWVYVPAGYKPDRSACLMIFQDGGSYLSENGPSKTPIVFDNLIHQGAMPPTLAVFVEPGVTPAPSPDAQPRYNRSYEYDAFTSYYADFLAGELLPEISERFPFSPDPDHHGLCGASSGGIAALTAAWFRPDAFRRVYSMIGTFVGLRGGDEFATLVRKTEPKPLRIFLQDGSNDLDIYAGDWWNSNQGMASALRFAGYETHHVWGEGSHSHQHGGAILAEAMRWLWKDFPQPVATHLPDSRHRAREWLDPSSTSWTTLFSSGRQLSDLTPLPDGSLLAADAAAGKILRFSSDGSALDPIDDLPGIQSITVTRDGHLVACLTDRRELVSMKADGSQRRILAQGLPFADAIASHDGHLYFTVHDSRDIHLLPPQGPPRVAGASPRPAGNLSLTPDQTRLEISDPSGRYILSAVRGKNGDLENFQPYHHLHLPPADVDPTSQIIDLAMTTDGYLIASSVMGLQFFDQPGRVNLILPAPPRVDPFLHVCTGGNDFREVFAANATTIFHRKIRLQGRDGFTPPRAAPKPGL